MHQLEKNSVAEFSKWAGNYDNNLATFTFKQTNAKITSTLNPKKNSSLLDVGCGSGILLDQLDTLNRSMKLFGIDITPPMVEVAKKKFVNRPSVQISQASAINLPFNDEFFDYVTCASSFHHHPDQKKSLSEMVRVLKPGGTVLILDMCVDGIIRKLFAKLENIYHNEGKVNRPTSQELYSLYSNVGLKNIQLFTYNYFHLIAVGTK